MIHFCIISTDQNTIDSFLETIRHTLFAINVLYREVFEPNEIKFYMASVTMWEEAFPGEETQYQDFVNRIKEYILFPYIYLTYLTTWLITIVSQIASAT